MKKTLSDAFQENVIGKGVEWIVHRFSNDHQLHRLLIRMKHLHELYTNAFESGRYIDEDVSLIRF